MYVCMYFLIYFYLFNYVYMFVFLLMLPLLRRPFGVEHTSTAVVSPGQAKGRRAPAPPRGKAPARRRGEGPSKGGLERIGRT